MKGLLETVLEKGRVNVSRVLSEIDQEYQVRQDYVVQPNRIQFNPSEKPQIYLGSKEIGFTDLTVTYSTPFECGHSQWAYIKGKK